MVVIFRLRRRFFFYKFFITVSLCLLLMIYFGIFESVHQPVVRMRNQSMSCTPGSTVRTLCS
ncbi:hypothetical protein NQ318_015098 [Aromia moschata]|uniref:Uncharacterized protein n=1 Tax=Aromia moschata TaxID=1265417 RepID=A0AAV8YZ29_9CUCU|nr:hypothetical protein NQ318_015098 [Aromia moschata]